MDFGVGSSDSCGTEDQRIWKSGGNAVLNLWGGTFWRMFQFGTGCSVVLTWTGIFVIDGSRESSFTSLRGEGDNSVFSEEGSSDDSPWGNMWCTSQLISDWLWVKRIRHWWSLIGRASLEEGTVWFLVLSSSRPCEERTYMNPALGVNLILLYWIYYIRRFQYFQLR